MLIGLYERMSGAMSASFTSLSSLRYALPRREPPLLVLHLFDINGSRELGRFLGTGAGAPTQCEVMETACKSEKEWRDLTGALMEE